jgi:hypothetical protein
VINPVGEPEWQDGAGGLLLLAAANVSGLLSQLEEVLPMKPPSLCVAEPSPQQHSQPQRSLLLTLLFLPAVGLHRFWDLRSYTGGELAILTGRPRPYSYRHTERFLLQLSSARADQALTEALARWTVAVWQVGERCREVSSPYFYVDGHRKPVYTETLIPRGLIGRLGKIAGCRALVLLHDEQGHPLLVTTHRGDLHLTHGIPQILTSYEQTAETLHVKHLVVDREAMAADFFAQLNTEDRTLTTILKTNQYSGLDDFLNVGPFVPLTVDRQGTIVREVAPAQFWLPRPDRQDEPLLLSVAL